MDKPRHQYILVASPLAYHFFKTFLKLSMQTFSWRGTRWEQSKNKYEKRNIPICSITFVLYIYIYIYIEREREREKFLRQQIILISYRQITSYNIYVYIYIYICIYIIDIIDCSESDNRIEICGKLDKSNT